MRCRLSNLALTLAGPGVWDAPQRDDRRAAS
jgi:hypothetical protein